VADLGWRVFDENSSGIDRFGVLLGVTAATVIMLSLVDLGTDPTSLGSKVGLVTVTLLVCATLILALRSSGVARRYRRIANVVIGFGIAATLVTILFEILPAGAEQAATRAPAATWLILSIASPVFVARRVLSHRRASFQTLMGAVSAYLLIALAFQFIFLALEAFSQEPFFGQVEPSTTYMYYSLVTITTLGYGDLTAVDALSRLASTMEAVIGQVYLVVFVGFIVGIFVSQRAPEEAGTTLGEGLAPPEEDPLTPD
jgi:Ion channel